MGTYILERKLISTGYPSPIEKCTQVFESVLLAVIISDILLQKEAICGGIGCFGTSI